MVWNSWNIIDVDLVWANIKPWINIFGIASTMTLLWDVVWVDWSLDVIMPMWYSDWTNKTSAIDANLINTNIKDWITIFWILWTYTWSAWWISSSYDVVAWDQIQRNDERTFVTRTWMVADEWTYYYFFHLGESRQWAPALYITDVFVCKIKKADWTLTKNLPSYSIWAYTPAVDKSITLIELDTWILKITFADATTANFSTLVDTRSWIFAAWPSVWTATATIDWRTFTPTVTAHSEWWFPTLNIS